MTGIVLFSTGATDDSPEFEKSVKRGFEPDEVSPPLPQEFVDSVIDPRTDRVHLWGTTAETKWESVEPGDVALVYRDGEYRAQAVVIGKEVNQTLAEALWTSGGDADGTDQPPRFLTFLVGVEEIELDRAEFNQLVEYDESYAPRGFISVADHRLDALLEGRESVESAIEALTGVPFLDFQENRETGPDRTTYRPSSVLLCEAETRSATEACTSLLSVADPDETHLLTITFDGTPDERLSYWQVRNDRLPEQTGVITVGETTRSSTGTAPAGPGQTPLSIDALPEPSDLTGLAMAISSYIEAWEDTDATTVVCFDSITPLVLHSDIEQVFRFLYTTIARLRDIGAYAHFHFDPAAHEERTVNLINSIFDAAVRVTEDGSVSVDRFRR